MNKARKLLSTVFVSALLILIGIAASPDDCFAADGDIDAGTYDGIPWAITSDYTLQIGEEGSEYTFVDDSSRYLEDYPWHPYAEDIQKVEVLGTVNGNGSLCQIFYGFENCKSIDVLNLDTSNVTNMSDMFSGCSSLTRLDLSSFDTSNVTDMSYMFVICNSLTELNVTSFNTGNVTDMHGMFNNCSSLTSLDVSNFNTSNVIDMFAMFSGCSSLTSLDISNFNTSLARPGTDDLVGLFDGCTSLSTLTTPNWSGSTAKLPTFPIKMKNADTQEVYAAGATFPAAGITTYEACEIIIDGNEETTVPKDTFEIIAGNDDMDLVIQGTDIQWTFHGSDVDPGKCKDIDVTTNIHKEKGEDMGFADDSQVLVIDFADNGELPGEAEIQVINDYISEEIASGTEQFKLSYVDGEQITPEDSGVTIDGGNTAIFRINHNSRFVLSAAMRSIGSAKVIVSNRIYNGKLQKPSVTVKLNGKKLDPKYYTTPQYSANKAVGTAKVKITGNSDFGYKGTASGTFYINPKKAAISNLKVGKKKITVKMKTKPAALGAAKYKIEYRIAGKGSWKSVTTTGNSKVIKKLKKGKKYQVRVTAIKGARKGAVSAIRTSKKVK